MTQKTFHALLLKIHSALSHTRYAVAGLAALVMFGYDSECAMPSRVTVLTGSDSAEALRSWAVTVGEWVSYRDRDESDIIGVLVRGGGGGEEWRGLTVKILGEEAVESLETAEIKELGGVRVVGLRGMLELRAGAWLGMMKKMDLKAGGGEEGSVDREMMVGQCERQLRWILTRLAAEGRVKIHPGGMKNFFSKDFWDGFLMREPRVKEILKALGVQREDEEVGGVIYTTVESRHDKREQGRFAPDSFRKRIAGRDPNPLS